MRQFKIIFLLFFVVSGQISFAQDPMLARADKLFENKVYHEAAKIYLSHLQQAYDYDANYKLAECYRLMNLTVEAEFWYEVIISQNTADEEMIFNYATLLKTNGKYRSAKEYFLKYAAYDDDGYYYASTCDWAIANENKEPAYYIDTLGINTAGSDITPAYFKKGFIYATGGGDDLNVSTGFKYYDLVYAERKNDSMWSAVPLNKNINSKLHEASPTYDPISKTLYFTRNNHYNNRTITSKDDEVKLEMFYADFVDGKFLAPKPMPFNSKLYSVGQPALSPDGTILIFASDRPGGYGGIDLYFTVKRGDEWSAIKNLGPVINSGGDELFPFMDNEGTLYFSSNYHSGFGGFDIFISKREGDHWSIPENAGKPLNSSHDDFGFIIKNGSGYFTSNRPGGKGSDDIYGVTAAKKLTAIYVYDTNLKPLSNVRITITESPKGQPICESDVNGMCDISKLNGVNMSIKISKEGYLDKVINDIGNYRSGNGILPVELQPLIGSIENKNTDQLNTQTGVAENN